MSPLSVASDVRVNNEASQPAPGAYIEQKCTQCRKLKSISEFPLSTRGPQKGIVHAKSCKSCTTYNSQKQERKKAEAEQNCPIIGFGRFLSVVEVALSEGLEARVSLIDFTLPNAKAAADTIADAVSEAAGYRFAPCRYHMKYDSRTSAGKHRFTYLCCQELTRQARRKVKKNANREKQRDKGKMESFECSGKLTVTIGGDRDMSFADITLEHELDHVPYCCVSLPADVRELIEKSCDKSPTQIWQDIRISYPMPNFSRKSVYQYWHNLVQVKWRSDADEVTSAAALLDETITSGKLGAHRFERIALEVPEGFSAFAFAIPEIIERWRERIREIAIDSAWGTNKGGYEIFALLAEAYGSGLPLGYLFIKNTGDPVPNSKRRVLISFLEHFRDAGLNRVEFTLSDKDWSEIGALQHVFPDAKHQLCFWHCLRAVKTRLATLHCQPTPCDVRSAVLEFSEIDRYFVPRSQQSVLAPDIQPTTKPIPRLVLRGTQIANVELVEVEVVSGGQGTPPSNEAVTRHTPNLDVHEANAPDGLAIGLLEVEALEVGAPKPRRVVLLLGKKTVSIPDPGSSPSVAYGVVGNAGGLLKKAGDDDEVDAREEGEAPETANLLRRIAQDVRECEEMDTEDLPDWEFEDGETKSKDKNYTFCPAVHRQGLLHLFTRHFCRHMIFPVRLSLGETNTAAGIRKKAVMEMYRFCKTNGLSEVWGYMWASWYSPTRWPLWSRLTSSRLSRLRTTMAVENHWKQLKHQYLHFMHRPRLDHALHVLCTKAVPEWILRSCNVSSLYNARNPGHFTIVMGLGFAGINVLCSQASVER